MSDDDIAPIATLLRNKQRADRLLLDLLSDRKGFKLIPRRQMTECLRMIENALNESAVDATKETLA